MGVGDSSQAGKGLPLSWALHAFWSVPSPISALPVASMWEACLSCLKSQGRVSDLCFDNGIWGFFLPSLVPTPHYIRHWTLAPQPLSCFISPFLQVAQPCTVSSTAETSVFVLCWVWGHKESLGVWGKAVLISTLLPGQGAAIFSLILPTDTTERGRPFGVGRRLHLNID